MKKNEKAEKQEFSPSRYAAGSTLRSDIENQLATYDIRNTNKKRRIKEIFVGFPERRRERDDIVSTKSDDSAEQK